jgi:putative phosphoribosyl transferase
MTSKPGGYVLPFPDRRAAGLLLAKRLADSAALDRWAGRAMVLGLPRGGVAVAQQVAAVLGLPMDVIVTRKIGYPPQPELGVGAIAEGLRQPVYDCELLERLGLTPEDLTPVVSAEEAELDRRVRIYRGGNPLPPVAGRCVIVVDDGHRSHRACGPAILAGRPGGAPDPRGTGRAAFVGQVDAGGSRSSDRLGQSGPVLVRGGVVPGLRTA